MGRDSNLVLKIGESEAGLKRDLSMLQNSQRAAGGIRSHVFGNRVV
jgi:hypothetical protein